MGLSSDNVMIEALPSAYQNALMQLVSTAADRFMCSFIPNNLSLEVETKRRATMFLVSHMLGPWLGFTVIGFLLAVDPGAGLPLCLAATALAAFWVFPFLLRFTGKQDILAFISVQNIAFIVLLLSYYYGGLSSPFLAWLITIPMLAFFYLGDNSVLRGLTLSALAIEIAIFYCLHLTLGAFPSRVPQEELSAIGLVSIFCAGAYVTMMAYYYARAVASRSDLEREIQRHKQTEVLLVDAKNKSEAADRAKSEFLASMSHELRTPLNAVIGFSETMAQELFGPLGNTRYKEYADDIQNSGKHLLEIINDILDLAKAESGNVDLDASLIDCADVVVSACRLIRPRLEKAHLRLKLDIPKHLPRLIGDHRRIKQVLLNVLSNAVKFTPAGGQVSISLSVDLIRGMIVEIRDSGIGIAREDLERVREPFVQADSTLHRQYEGTGLGLPLVELMMQQHGGQFILDSTLGVGTIAQLIFPLDRLVWSGGGDSQSGENSPDLSLVPNQNPPLATSAEPADNPFDVPSVLVVEDDGDLRDLLVRMLKRAGFTVTGVENGRHALRHLTEYACDLVVTDMIMPEMDGIELMTALQRDRPELPVIAVSGVDDFKEYSRISNHLGARAALRKPVSQAEIVATINRVLSGSGLQKAG